MERDHPELAPVGLDLLVREEVERARTRAEERRIKRRMVEQRDRYGCRSTYKKKTSKNFVFIDIAQKCNYVQNITALVLTFITMLKQSMIDCFSWRYHGNFLKICTNALTCSSAI